MEHLIKMNHIQMKDEFFVHYSSHTLIDEILSNEDGLPKGVNYMVIGDPGVGKTTVMLDLLANLKQANPDLKTLFISAEMNEIDLYSYVKRYPKFGDIDIFFADKDIHNIKLNHINLTQTLQSGFDVVVIDSFLELQSIIKEELNLTIKDSESFILNLIKTHNLAKNQAELHTTFLTIQQVTKSGDFAGSNRLKHMITGMMEMRLTTKNDIYSDRHISFSKHRRGPVGVKVYYSLNQNLHVEYNREKFDLDQQIKRDSEKFTQELKHFHPLKSQEGNDDSIRSNLEL